MRKFLKFIMALPIGLLVLLSAPDTSGAQGTANSRSKAQDTQYVALSPWADVDPIPLRGLSPRIQTLAGKKIGLFVNPKRAAMPMAESIQKRLRSMYPDIQIALFHSTQPNVNEIETKNRERFTAWAKGVDAAIALVGD